MLSRPALMAAWTLAALPAGAQSPAWQRAAAAAHGAPFAFESFDAAVEEPSASPAPAAAGVISPGLWASLPPADPASLAWLAQRVPGVDQRAIRVMSAADADAILAKAAGLGQTALDLFTDQGFRGRELFYIPQAALGALFSRWDLRIMTAYSGRADDGVPFQMQGMLVGGGRIEILYDRSDITFHHPELENGQYTLQARVTETILGPGDLGITGVVVHVGIFSPRINRVVKVSATENRVETSLGSRVKPARAISRKA